MAQARLGVLIIHGIGDDKGPIATRRGYSQGLQTKLRERDLTPAQVEFEEVYWHDHMQRRQDRYWQGAEPRVRWDYVRKLILNHLADASTYRQVPDQEDTVYARIHGEVHRSLTALEGRIASDAPLVVMAHSLGAHIMSNYIWDRQRCRTPDPLGDTAFRRMERLVSMVSFGGNLPLFVMAADPYEPITIPAATLPEPLRALGRWFNYYDKDDVLGWPMAPLAEFVSEEHRSAFEAMVQDIPIDVGVPVLQSSNPTSHVGYWKDRDFVGAVGEHLRGLLVATA